MLAVKAMLAARSPYFNALLFGAMAEARRVMSPVSLPSTAVPLTASLPPHDSPHSLRRPSPPPLPASHTPPHEPSSLFQTLCGSPFVSPHSSAPVIAPHLPSITIDQWSYAAFRCIVVYLVTNRITVTFEDAVETMALADAYGEPKLKAACLSLIISRLDVDNVIPLLIQADHVSANLTFCILALLLMCCLLVCGWTVLCG